MRLTLHVHPVFKHSLYQRPQFPRAGQRVIRVAVLAVLSTSLVQLPNFAQSIVSSAASEKVSSQSAKQAGTIDIDFVDTTVTDILSTIGDMNKVNIVVSSNVPNEKIPSLHLHDITVEEAIQTVALAANLTWRKERNVYIVSKAPAPSIGAITPSSESNGFLAPNSNSTPSPGTSTNGDLASLGIPDISNSSSAASQSKTFRVVNLRNVKPSLMAFWLDPSRHPEPVEMQQAHEKQRTAGDSYNRPQSMQEEEQARTDKRRAALNREYGPGWQNSGVGMPNGYNPQANPYANPYGAMSPYTQFSNQFGGGGGGNNSGGGNNNNSGNNNSGGGGGGGGGGQRDLASAAGIIPLPPGIDNIIAIDPQNAILVQGTGEGIEQIENIIAYLDRPLQQVEIEAQFVELTEEAGRALGVDFTSNANSTSNFFGSTDTSTTNSSSVLIGYVGNNFTVTLNALRSRNLLKIVNSPRVTTFNNLTAQLRSLRTTFILTRQTNVSNPGGGNAPTQTTTDIVNAISSGVVLTVTPTINRDGTITMAIQPIVSSTVDRGTLFPDIVGQEISTVANVKDGDTLAVGGLRVKTASDVNRRVPLLSSIPILGPLLFSSKNKVFSERELVIFLTARIVRRTEEPIPGV